MPNKNNDLFPEPRKEIKKMKSYQAPLENRRELLRLDFNENTLGPSPLVLEAIRKIELNEISIYPEYNLLKSKLCEDYLKSEIIQKDEIGIFNGADAAINAIFNSFGENKDIFLTTDPTFGYYFPCANMRGMRTIKSTYEGDAFLFPFANFKKNILKYKPKLIFICNPNNPTGTVLSAEKILELANLNKTSLLVIDELYEKFNGDSLLPKIDFKKFKNVVVIQSLSKTAGLAGLRIGFAFGNKEVIKYIIKVTGPYDVNSFAVRAAIAAFDDQEYIANYVLKIKDSRDWIQEKFNSIKTRCHFSGGNYFLLWPNKSPEVLEEKMKKKGILIRSMKNKKDIDDTVRVSIGTQDQMEYFWRIYKEIDL